MTEPGDAARNVADLAPGKKNGWPPDTNVNPFVADGTDPSNVMYAFAVDTVQRNPFAPAGAAAAVPLPVFDGDTEM